MSEITFFLRQLAPKQQWTPFPRALQSCLVDADSCLAELTPYIHLNPVGAGMVKSQEEYPWSGHRAYLGSEEIPWLTTEWVLSQFGGSIARSRRGYRKFVEMGREPKKGGGPRHESADPRKAGCTIQNALMLA